jgi:hypothetical protein
MTKKPLLIALLGATIAITAQEERVNQLAVAVCNSINWFSANEYNQI